MLLMVEKDIGGGIYHAIHQYTKANNKYIKDYDKNNVRYPESLHKLHNDLPIFF